MTAKPARVISVMNPWARRIVAGLQVVVERTWKPSWRGVLWIHASKDSDLSAPAGLWPPAGQLTGSAIIGYAALADVEGGPARGGYRGARASWPVAHRLAARAFWRRDRPRLTWQEG